MQFILDHLITIVVASVVVFLIAGVTMTQAEGTRDVTRFYDHQRVQAEFVGQVEADLTSAGLGTPVGAAPVQAATSTSFAFYGVVDAAGTTGLIEYREVPAGTADGATVASVERYVDGVYTGASGGRVTAFAITPLDAAGAPLGAASLGATREVRVEVEWAVPHAEGGDGARRQALRRSAWRTDIRPIALQG